MTSSEKSIEDARWLPTRRVKFKSNEPQVE